MAPHNSLSRLLRPSICSSCRHTLQTGQRAPLSASARRCADDSPAPPTSAATPSRTPTSAPSSLDSSGFSDLRKMAETLSGGASNPLGTRPGDRTTGLLSQIVDAQSQPAASTHHTVGVKKRQELHHMHVYSHKHNTHITLTRPNREPILSYSCGNIGFKKGQRGTFDAGFQLAAYCMRMISDKGLLRMNKRDEMWREGDAAPTKSKMIRKVEQPIMALEVILKGFGKGREAVTKALLGAEGRYLRDRITYVSDDTKLKFGGCKGSNPRRL